MRTHRFGIRDSTTIVVLWFTAAAWLIVILGLLFGGKELFSMNGTWMEPPSDGLDGTWHRPPMMLFPARPGPYALLAQTGFLVPAFWLLACCILLAGTWCVGSAARARSRLERAAAIGEGARDAARLTSLRIARLPGRIGLVALMVGLAGAAWCVAQDALTFQRLGYEWGTSDQAFTPYGAAASGVLGAILAFLGLVITGLARAHLWHVRSTSGTEDAR